VSSKAGRPAVALRISGSKVFNITKITTPVTIAILYLGDNKAGSDVFPEIGVNQNCNCDLSSENPNLILF
jgi:hypothetical protein